MPIDVYHILFIVAVFKGVRIKARTKSTSKILICCINAQTIMGETRRGNNGTRHRHELMGKMLWYFHQFPIYKLNWLSFHNFHFKNDIFMCFLWMYRMYLIHSLDCLLALFICRYKYTIYVENDKLMRKKTQFYEHLVLNKRCISIACFMCCCCCRSCFQELWINNFWNWEN